MIDNAAKPKIGIAAIPLATILFVVFVALAVALTKGTDIGVGGGIAVSAVAVIAWSIIGRGIFTVYAGCYRLAFGRPFAAIQSSAGHVNYEIEKKQLLRTFCILVWPIFLFIACPILGLIWYVGSLFSD